MSVGTRHGLRVAAAVLLTALAMPAAAVQKCTAPDGRTSYQDHPCPSQGKALVLEDPFRSLDSGKSPTDGAQRRQAQSAEATRATSSGLPYVGMTAAALERLMGPPDRVSRTSYADGAAQDRTEYQRNGRLLRVYVLNGKVVEVQNRALPQRAAKAPCPSALDIRNMETKTGNRTDPPERVAENKRLLREMRARK
jgi:hypothetical protein